MPVPTAHRRLIVIASPRSGAPRASTGVRRIRAPLRRPLQRYSCEGSGGSIGDHLERRSAPLADWCGQATDSGAIPCFHPDLESNRMAPEPSIMRSVPAASSRWVSRMPTGSSRRVSWATSTRRFDSPPRRCRGKPARGRGRGGGSGPREEDTRRSERSREDAAREGDEPATHPSGDIPHLAPSRSGSRSSPASCARPPCARRSFDPARRRPGPGCHRGSGSGRTRDLDDGTRCARILNSVSVSDRDRPLTVTWWRVKSIVRSRKERTSSEGSSSSPRRRTAFRRAISTRGRNGFVT